LIEHQGQRLVGLRLVAFGGGVAASGNLAQQALGFPSGKGRRDLPMPSEGDTACPPFAPSELILNEVNLAARWRHLEPKAMQFPVPKVAVDLAGFGSIYSPFCDVGSGDDALLLLPTARTPTWTRWPAPSNGIVTTERGNNKN
jgi:hypothetical protein